MSFEANQGQSDAQVRFLSRGSGYALFLTPGQAVLSLRKPAAQASPSTGQGDQAAAATVLRMQLLGANLAAPIAGENPQSHASHYLLGKNPDHWRTGVPNFERVRYTQVYEGIDLVFYGQQREIEYDFIVAPGHDPRRIEWSLQGIHHLALNNSGDLVLSTPAGDLGKKRPVIYQEHGGRRDAVQGRYVLKGENRVGFEIAAYDRTRALVIDPVLSYSTYLGGSGTDDARAIAVDAAGNAYVAGFTNSADFPTGNAADASFNGGAYDAFVTKLNRQGNGIVYSTYLGGSGIDDAVGIAVDAAGNAVVAGGTSSADFPMVHPLYGHASGGGRDAWVAKLNRAGNAITWSTYLGGSGDDYAAALKLDAAGHAYVAGFTGSADFPTTPNALNIRFGGGGGDAFVAKLAREGTALVYSTYLGGSGYDFANGVDVDAAGSAYVTGATTSVDFPTAGAAGGALRGIQDAFATRLNPAGSRIAWSMYLGGSDVDVGLAIAVDAQGFAYVAGYTGSTDFPVLHALQPGFGDGGTDAFVTKLGRLGQGLVYSTYLGGSGPDVATGIAVDAAGRPHVAGYTSSANFPTTHALDRTLGGPQDAFVARLSLAGSALLYSTYLGGGGGDFANAIALDRAGNAYVTGVTASTNFPRVNALDRTLGGTQDAFVSKIGLQRELGEE